LRTEELENLRESLLKRDHVGLNQLYKDTKPKCVKILISKKYCNEAVAEEIFTDAILIFRKNLISGKITKLTDPVNYLVSVCTNLIKSEKRANLKSQNKESEVRLLFYNNGHNLVDEQTEKEHLIEKCKTALLSLTERCQQILTAYYIHELSMKEIAIELKLSSSDVAKTLKSRGFKSWKNAINTN